MVDEGERISRAAIRARRPANGVPWRPVADSPRLRVPDATAAERIFVPVRLELVDGPGAPGGPLTADGVAPWVECSTELTESGPPPRCLDRFIRLDDGPLAEFPARVLEFARQFGPLGLRFPLSWPKSHALVRDVKSHALVLDVPESDEWAETAREPLEEWLRYVRHTRAVLLVAEHLRQGSLGDPRDWSAIAAAMWEFHELVDESGSVVDVERVWSDLGLTTYWGDAPPGEEPEATLEEGRGSLGEVLDSWLRFGGVKLAGGWDGADANPHLVVVVGGADLRGLLAVQLAASLLAGVYVCAGCKKPFTPKPGRRRPASGRPPWCDDCGRPAQKRATSNKAYHRKKAAARGSAPTDPEQLAHPPAG